MFVNEYIPAATIERYPTANKKNILKILYNII